MRKTAPKRTACALMAFAAISVSACTNEAPSVGPSCAPVSGAIQIPAGTYAVGTDEAYPEEGPAQTTQIDTFWIGKTEVTTKEFAEFIDETGYKTVAERDVDPAAYGNVDMPEEAKAHFLSPGGAVFDPTLGQSQRQLSWWAYVPGANWKHPQGPDKAPAAANDPVTQIALEDALTYARWAGGRLPTEAEWEIAASIGAGLDTQPKAAPMNANTWQGLFPVANEESDGYSGVAPVACFPPDKAGLYDMIGNVWEWTADPYQDRRSPVGVIGLSSLSDDRATSLIGTVKGGSFLCAPNYCMRYRPAARQAQETGLGTNHIGFRLVYDEDPQGGS